jgi:hypothetical protein
MALARRAVPKSGYEADWFKTMFFPPVSPLSYRRHCEKHSAYKLPTLSLSHFHQQSSHVLGIKFNLRLHFQFIRIFSHELHTKILDC